MRIIAAIGAAAFAYLTLIPASLLGSTIDPACAGSGCATSLASDILFVILYSACAITLAGTALALAWFAVRPELQAMRWIARVLPASAVALGVTFFALFSIANPIAGGVAVAIGALSYTAIRRNRENAGPRPRRRTRLGPPPRIERINGHAHPHKNGDLPHI